MSLGTGRLSADGDVCNVFPNTSQEVNPSDTLRGHREITFLASGPRACSVERHSFPVVRYCTLAAAHIKACEEISCVLNALNVVYNSGVKFIGWHRPNVKHSVKRRLHVSAFWHIWQELKVLGMCLHCEAGCEVCE